METLSRALLGICLVLLSGCGAAQRFQLAEAKPPVPKPGSEPVFLSGTLPLSEGGRVLLESLSDRPTVLIFASDTCDVCAAEVRAIRLALTRPKEEPDRVKVLNAVVSAGSQDAYLWKLDHALPWNVGFDEKLALFHRWCGPGSVPCTVVQLPQKGIVLTHRGELTPKEIEALTGPLERTP